MGNSVYVHLIQSIAALGRKLVGGLEHFYFSIQLGMSSPQLTKSIIFQRGRLKPPTSIYP